MKLDEVLGSNELVVIDFYSSECPPCKLVEHELQKVQSELKSKVSIFQVDQQKQGEVFSAFKVQHLPHVKLFKSGRPVWSISGLFSKDEMLNEILKHQ
jgi:thioredoxin 1